MLTPVVISDLMIPLGSDDGFLVFDEILILGMAAMTSVLDLGGISTTFRLRHVLVGAVERGSDDLLDNLKRIFDFVLR